MPSRIVRESILRSRKVNALSWEAECFYRRLINVVDDFGLYHADIGILMSGLFPRKLTDVTAEQVAGMLSECVTQGLIVEYSCGGDSYLRLLNTDPPRAKKPKYPLPPTSECNGKQMQTDADKCPVDEDEDVVVIEYDDDVVALIYDFWRGLRSKRPARASSSSSCSIREALDRGLTQDQILDAVDRAHRDGWYCGDNQKRTTFLSLRYLLKPEEVEKILEKEAPLDEKAAFVKEGS